MASVPFLCVTVYGIVKFDVLFERYILRYTLAHMSEEYKKKIYALFVAQSPGMSQAVPEPLVGRILKDNMRFEESQAEILTNNAGMRCKDPYLPKKPDAYRIICLGDSMVYGQGGKEKDRFGDPIEQILSKSGVRVGGKKIEVYSVGVGGWTALNEATYLSSRLSDYQPDLVLALMVMNDITDALAVSEAGQPTLAFSPDHRDYGSGVFANIWPSVFGIYQGNLLQDDLGPESRTRWEKTFAAWKRLETLLDERNAKMIFGLLDENPLFTELCKHFYKKNDMHSPFILVRYFDNSLPQDYHPNREGHRIIALHYLHTLARLGWLPVTNDELPALDPRLDAATAHPPNASKILSLKKERIDGFLDEQIDFDHLSEHNTLAFLGGIYPGSIQNPLKTPPYASLKCGFLLKRKKGAKRLALQVEVPPYVELYPFKLEMRLNGRPSAQLTLNTVQDSGKRLLEAAIPKTSKFGPAIEVVLVTRSYWTTIDDPTMKSYRLVSVSQE